MKSAALMIVGVVACGGAKAKPAEVSNTAPGSGSASGEAQRRVYDFSGETLARDAKDEPGNGPVSVEKGGIRGEIQRHRGTFAACVAKDPAAKGQIALVFGIAGSGAIGDVYVNGVGNDDVKACLTAAVKTFAFAADAGGVMTEVHYPLTVGAP